MNSPRALEKKLRAKLGLPKTGRPFTHNVVGVLLFALIGGVYYSIYAISQLPNLIIYFSQPTHRLLGLLALGAVATALFAFRLLARKYYGVCEIAFGFAVAWDALTTVSSEGIGKWSAVVAAAYLLVRGLDNLHEGLGSPLKANARAVTDAGNR